MVRSEDLHVLIVAENTHVKMRQDIVSTVAFLSVAIVIFFTYSSEELTNHIKKKHSFCQYNVKFCAQQSPNTLQQKVKPIIFY